VWRVARVLNVPARAASDVSKIAQLFVDDPSIAEFADVGAAYGVNVGSLELANSMTREVENPAAVSKPDGVARSVIDEGIVHGTPW